MDEKWVSRFLRASDPQTDVVLAPLPKTWWSRPYEYRWAQEFADAQATVLDAAAGVSHPFKFWLAAHCQAAHACDHDPRLLTADALRQGIADDFGPEVADQLIRTYLPRLALVLASVFDLPYAAKSFDRIFCLSVLEHLSEDGQHRTLAEFERTLANNGLIVVSLDYPTVDLAFFHHTIAEAGLAFAGPVDFSLRAESLSSPDGALRCFRAVLCHRGTGSWR